MMVVATCPLVGGGAATKATAQGFLLRSMLVVHHDGL